MADAVQKPVEGRNFQLDCLRGIAILLVLLNHCCHLSTTNYPIFDFFRHGSWMGVDLFFVLSGFLVSGLLFKDTVVGKKPDIVRFLIRRSFKIYPSYFLLVATGWLLLANRTRLSDQIKTFFPLFIFVQNYVPSYQMFGHTWSLAVEEHFYALIALGFFLLRRGTLSATAIRNICLGIIVLIPLIRLAEVCSSPTNLVRIGANYESHLRIDSLAVGVVVSWIWHYHRIALNQFCDKYRYVMPPLGLALLSPSFLMVRGSPFQFSIGYSMVAVGCALLLLSALRLQSKLTLMRPVAYLGKHSYSVYLWHAMILMAVSIGCMTQPLLFSPAIEILAVFSGSIIWGILSSLCMDAPMLKVSDAILKKHDFMRKPTSPV